MPGPTLPTTNDRPKPTPLWRWILARTDWLAVISCIPLSAGLVLYCVPVSQAHGYSKDLFSLASGGQSSLAWLATVYAVTLGITLPLSVIGIIYSLLVVAASIYAHRHIYPDTQAAQQQQQAGRQQSMAQQQLQTLQQQPQAPVLQHYATAPLTQRHGGSPPEQPRLLSLNGSLHGGLSPGGGSLTQPQHPSPPPSLRKATSMPLGPAPAGPSASAPSAAATAAVPVQDLAGALKGDKGQAAGLWERALGLARVPGGMQSVLGLLSGGESPGPLGGKPPAPREAVVVDLTKLKSPTHRRLPSMSMAMAISQARQHQANQQQQQAAQQAAQQQQAQQQEGAAEGSGGTGPGLGPGPGTLSAVQEGGLSASGRQGPWVARLSSDDCALSDVEKDAQPSSSAQPACATGRGAGGLSAVRQCWGKAAAAVRSAAPALLVWQGKAGKREEAAGGGLGPGEAAAGSPVGTPRKEGPGTDLQQGGSSSYRAYRTLNWMLLTLIAANTATLLWLVILLVATGAWLVCSEAIKVVAQDTLRVDATSLGAATAALGLTQQNQAAVSTFSELFGLAFLSAVNNATGGKYDFTSYQQLQQVSEEDPALLGSAAATAYNATAWDSGTAAIVEPQFYAPGSATSDVALPCPSTCLNFRYFNFLESGACICDPSTIQEVSNLAGGTVDRLAISLAGLALMIVSVLVLLLRFATHRGQVQTRWALRPALQLYASHREETLLKRHWQRGRPMFTPTHSV